MSKLNPYISFDGNAKEAMEFYKSVFGGELTFTTFKEGGMPADQGNPDHIMHSMLEAKNGMTLMGADTPPGMEFKAGGNVSLSLSGDEEAELTGYYNKLAEGGTPVQPLVKAPWGDIFGMVVDKFGTFWMVNITAKKD